MVSVLIVDDSAFVRRSLTILLERDPDIRVLGTAADGIEALEALRTLDPDVITLDVEMPRMDGLSALARIMEEYPRPVIMISSLTETGAETTLRAMELGALDYIPKLNSAVLADLEQTGQDLAARVKALARRKAFVRLLHKKQLLKEPSVRDAGPGKKPPAMQEDGHRTLRPGYDAVVIGVSTGGPPAVHKIFSALPADFPVPVLVAQHMPAAFTGAFAKRLNDQCALAVKEAAGTERLRPGTVYIAPGGQHLRLENRKGTLYGTVCDDPQDALYKPSVNVLLDSAGLALGRRALAVVLTGMGSDGQIGARTIKERGGWVIAQNEASCVVFGMPKAVVDAGLADDIVDIHSIAERIMARMGV